MHIAPERLLQLLWSNNLSGMREQELESRKLLGRKMNRRISAEEGAIGFKTEACKGEAGVLMGEIKAGDDDPTRQRFLTADAGNWGYRMNRAGQG